MQVANLNPSQLNQLQSSGFKFQSASKQNINFELIIEHFFNYNRKKLQKKST